MERITSVADVTQHQQDLDAGRDTALASAQASHPEVSLDGVIPEMLGPTDRI